MVIEKTCGWPIFAILGTDQGRYEGRKARYLIQRDRSRDLAFRTKYGTVTTQGGFAACYAGGAIR